MFHRRRSPAQPKMDGADIAALTKAGAGDPCPYCGGWHLGICPRVRSIDYGSGGGVASVTFWHDWDASSVLWPGDWLSDPEVFGE